MDLRDEHLRLWINDDVRILALFLIGHEHRNTFEALPHFLHCPIERIARELELQEILAGGTTGPRFVQLPDVRTKLGDRLRNLAQFTNVVAADDSPDLELDLAG